MVRHPHAVTHYTHIPVTSNRTSMRVPPGNPPSKPAVRNSPNEPQRDSCAALPEGSIRKRTRGMTDFAAMPAISDSRPARNPRPSRYTSDSAATSHKPQFVSTQVRLHHCINARCTEAHELTARMPRTIAFEDAHKSGKLVGASGEAKKEMSSP